MMPDEEPLPVMDSGLSWEQLQAMNGVNMTEEDAMAAGMVPDAVANDVAAEEPEVRRAEPNMQPTGAFMDLGFIDQINNAATDEEATAMYNALDPVQKRVYDRSYGININPEWAANEASKFYQEQDEQRKLATSPATQREQRIAEKEDKLARETMIRQQQVLDKIDRYTNPEHPDYVDIANLVGPWDGTAGGMIDATIGSKEKATMRAELERLVNNDVLELTKFLRPISQDELKFLKTMTPRMYQNENIWRSYLQDTKQRLLGDAVRPPQSQPNLYQQAKQDPAAQLRQQFEQSDELTLPNGQKLKRVVDQNGNIGWEPQ